MYHYVDCVSLCYRSIIVLVQALMKTCFFPSLTQFADENDFLTEEVYANRSCNSSSLEGSSSISACMLLTEIRKWSFIRSGSKLNSCKYNQAEIWCPAKMISFAF